MAWDTSDTVTITSPINPGGAGGQAVCLGALGLLGAKELGEQCDLRSVPQACCPPTAGNGARDIEHFPEPRSEVGSGLWPTDGRFCTHMPALRSLWATAGARTMPVDSARTPRSDGREIPPIP